MFDFETSDLKKVQFITSMPADLLRHDRDCCELEFKNVDIDEKWGEAAQKLINIKKQHNRYILESPDIDKMNKMNKAERKLFMARDID